MLYTYIEKNGIDVWGTIPPKIPGRTAKQCRERWQKSLNPDIVKTAWTYEEDKTLIDAYILHGNHWVEIKKILPGRTDVSIRNHWSTIQKKIKSYFQSLGAETKYGKLLVYSFSRCKGSLYFH
jgi:hypothetical protein